MTNKLPGKNFKAFLDWIEQDCNDGDTLRVKRSADKSRDGKSEITALLNERTGVIYVVSEKRSH